MTDNTPIRLQIPQPDLSEFSHFELDEEAAAGWCHSLPMANAQLAAQQLRHVISDLNRVSLSPQLRFGILEVLRPNLSVALSSLKKRFINQPLIMPEEPRQMAELADTLNGLATTGYAMVALQAKELTQSMKAGSQTRLVCEAVYRGIQFCGQTILQSLQLYQPVESGQWLTLHQLFTLAEQQQLTRLPITEPTEGSQTIACVYLQALLLACCKPNQLRQSDLGGIHRGLRQWCKFAHLSAHEACAGLFIVDLSSDSRPSYRTLAGEEPGEHHRCIRTEALVEHLSALRQQCHRLGKAGVQFEAGQSVPLNILDHVIWSLGTMSQRDFARLSGDGNLWIAIGLSSVHYHLSGARTFNQLLYGDAFSAAATEQHDNPFLPSGGASDITIDDADRPGAQEPIEGYIVVEADGPGSAGFLDSQQLSPEARYPVMCVRIVNASPAGYGLEWPSDISGNLKTGDIVCAKEGSSEEWSVAAVRWVDQPRQEQTVVGIELLSPTAKAYGAIIHQKTGAEGEPMRVLLLPEIKLVGQSHTLITPRAAFKENQKVSLLREGEEFLIQLQRQLAITGNYARFDFRYIKQLEEVVAEDMSAPLDSAYDSVWSSI